MRMDEVFYNGWNMNITHCDKPVEVLVMGAPIP